MRSMDIPRELHGLRYVGDKRNQVVYDMEAELTDPSSEAQLAAAVADIVAAQSYAAFGPDELPEARNRGYRLSRLCR